MSGFKDMVASDRAKFLDVDAFGETYTVNGAAIPIVIDTDELKTRQGGQDLAVAESATLFYARKEDLPARHSPGSTININGRECIIDDWKEDMGIVTVVLRENISA